MRNLINKITVEILFCLMSTLENCLILIYLLWFSTRVQMEKNWEDTPSATLRKMINYFNDVVFNLKSKPYCSWHKEMLCEHWAWTLKVLLCVCFVARGPSDKLLRWVPFVARGPSNELFLNERGVVSLGWQKSSSVKVLENMTLFAHRCYTEKKSENECIYMQKQISK